MMNDEQKAFQKEIHSLPTEELRRMLDPHELDPDKYLLVVGELICRILKKPEERAKYILKAD